MADQEVIKHTKKIYKIWNSKEHTFWHKAKEFVLEIFIIVFAVSLSIWLHGQSEHAHKTQDVKNFLLGMENDFQNDLKEMKADREMFLKSKEAFNYIRGLKMGQRADADTIKKYNNYLFNETGLLPNNGRFEGFKSSGKIGDIEHLKIQNEMMDLYQENIPTLVLYTNYYSKKKSALDEFFIKNLRRKSDQGNNYLDLFSSEEVYNMSYDLTQVRSIISQYDKCIGNMNSIISEINKEYKD
jgi:hypothetical protein